VLRYGLVIVVALSLTPGSTSADERTVRAKTLAEQSVDRRKQQLSDVALQIWEYAELGYHEKRSSALLQDLLRGNGFEVNAGVAGPPTAFVASYGSGRPIIGLMAEFDALPGLSQKAVPRREPRVEGGTGHGCGHHLFGTGAAAAAVALKEWLAAHPRTGTIRVYGSPAEEGGAGKVYMVRAGLFDDVDVILDWHPSDRNDASPEATLAMMSAKFRFRGQSAHAATYPDRGRSALDGVQAMNFMVEMAREHLPAETRIHYVITHGGAAPNVVPDFAEVFYYARHPSAARLREVWERLNAAAAGAAQGTGTRFEVEIINGVHDVLPNATLSGVMDRNFRRLGGISYTAEEQAFARAIRESFEGTVEMPLGSESRIQPFKERLWMASSDVGDVSWVAPVGYFRTACWVPGTAGHSWQAVAAGGTSVGLKGMLLAAKVLASTAIDLLYEPALVTRARAELDQRRGPDFNYSPLIGDRPPPLDYAVPDPAKSRP
jgi:aminobenzoyl-glutamate utilization protein B